MRRFFFLLLFCLFFYSHASVIRGRAHITHAGKVIEAYTYKDFITQIPVTLDKDTIHHDGFFELEVGVHKTLPVFLKIHNVTIKMYVQPDYVYGVIIPEFDESVYVFRHREHFVALKLISHKDDELNTLILDFDSLYQFTFFPDREKFLNKTMLYRLIDTLKKKSDERYKNIKNTYFNHYREYFLANLNVSISRGEKAFIHHYLLKRYIQPDDYEMMELFRTSFKDYLKSISASQAGASLYRIINEFASYEKLNEWCKKDEFLKKDTLRELVMIYNLWNFYYEPEFGQQQVKSILSQLQNITKIQTHKNIIQNMMTLWNKLLPGSAAPTIYGLGLKKEMLSSEKLKGKWIYFNFFSDKNENSIKEMGIIHQLYKKFGNKMYFISMAVDMTHDEYLRFIKKYPQYKWNIWFNDAQAIANHASKAFSLTGNEAYYLIMPSGEFALSPAPAPSEGMEHRLNAIFKIKKKHITGIR
ncbi:MAG: hypothetical protein N3F09_02090 [Bacteroidia bacterium]|nr:hypothetical protein [Bacteroidia bacterium]